jgi:hypothetical protein
MTGPNELEPRVSVPRELGAQLRPNVRRLRRSLAGMELGAYDEVILGWLATWEPSTVEVMASWIERAREGAAQPEPGPQAHGKGEGQVDADRAEGEDRHDG